jgi:hypothetical protein
MYVTGYVCGLNWEDINFNVKIRHDLVISFIRCYGNVSVNFFA